MKNYILPENVAQAVLQYLGTQPYTQVAPLIQALGQMEEVSPQLDAAAIAASLAQTERSPAKKPSKAATKGGK